MRRSPVAQKIVTVQRSYVTQEGSMLIMRCTLPCNGVGYGQLSPKKKYEGEVQLFKVTYLKASYRFVIRSEVILTICTIQVVVCRQVTSQWGAADAESKVPSGENTELKR